jgi:hypothetical protein
VGAHSPPAALSRGARARAACTLLVGAILAALFFRAFVLELRVVSSGSMSPTLAVGDHVLVDRLIYRQAPGGLLSALLPVRDVRRGDVVLLRSPEDGRTVLVKRCVALPGDLVPAGVVPAASVFVVGDDRADSRDSRVFGPVERSLLLGRVVAAFGSRSARAVE